ncbi:MAG: periplasmic heavy metal sensor [Magnetococcales bacterium]|nr:periplasmic heavy metal sensor [Magnetococcales bacterium]
MYHKNRQSILVLACAMTMIGYGSLARAQESAPAEKTTQAAIPKKEGEAPATRKQHHQGRHERHHAFLAKIHPLLKLTPEQEQRWQTLEKETEAIHQAMRDQGKGHGELIRKALEQDAPNLAALLAEHDKAMDSRVQEHRRIRDRWIALYGDLTPEQKNTVRASLKELLGQMEARREKWKNKKKDHATSEGY